jgi:hypothetical protein
LLPDVPPVLKRDILTGWRHHPGVRTGEQLTAGERAADLVRNGMGSWPFVFSFLAFMGLWAAANGSDPYPFNIAQRVPFDGRRAAEAIRLISAQRAGSISSEVALHTLRNTARLEGLIEANTALTATVSDLATQIHAHVCLTSNSR